MSLYGNEVIDFAAYTQARAMSEQLSANDYINATIRRIIDETGAFELDDATARNIVKYQSRQLLHRLFELSHLVLNELTQDAISGLAPKDKVQMVVGLIGRISTLTESLAKLEASTSGDEAEWVRKLQSLPRDQMLNTIRDQFARVFSTLFTDEERERLFGQLERDKVNADFGTGTAPEDGEGVGSTRWYPREGSIGILPTARAAEFIPSK